MLQLVLFFGQRMNSYQDYLSCFKNVRMKNSMHNKDCLRVFNYFYLTGVILFILGYFIRISSSSPMSRYLLHFCLQNIRY